MCEPYWGENNLMLLYPYSMSKPMEKNYSFTWGYIKTIYMHDTSLNQLLTRFEIDTSLDLGYRSSSRSLDQRF
jgi:hypothetical protein